VHPSRNSAAQRRYCKNPAFTSFGESNRIGTGFTRQMPLQYSRTVRSEENFPERAAFKIDMRDQCSGSA
jgi:hypothetical protein